MGAQSPQPLDSVAYGGAQHHQAAAAASSSGSAGGSQQQQQSLASQQRGSRQSRRFGENIVILLCMNRVRRMGGRWYRAVSHIRTGKKKKEKKRIFKPSDYARLREASDAAMVMSDTELADIVASLLKKIFKEIQEEHREAFVRVWLDSGDDSRCVLTLPDGKGKMKRIDGLRGSDKVWRLDTLVAILFHGVPMDSTDTGLL
uniref:CTF/NF-I domain-containing protein n=1 Tax=Macrostomum lignano TaxID=282301 RepID=A0A1I8IAJ1_9PLAT